MRKSTSLLTTIFLSCLSNALFAQIVGTSAFLKGQYLEIGMQGNGSFGANGSPAGYHPHSPGTATGSVLNSVYDHGHDGWTAGIPAFMGDYMQAGLPFEGWEIQWGGSSRVQGFQTTGAGYTFAGGATMTSSGITSYTSSTGQTIAKWYGLAGGQLAMNTETYVDTGASWVVVNVKLKNIGSTTVPGIYYFRSCDPDIDQTWSGGGFVSDNWVTYQDDAQHRVLISAKGTLANTYLGLGTFDSRAVGLSYTSWPLTIGQDLAAVWNRTFSGNYGVGSHYRSDIAIGLVFNIGNIAPGDTATFSYAYVFNDSSGLDDAFVLTGGTPSRLDSFSVKTNKDCSGAHLTIYNDHYTPGMTIKTSFGDGTSVVTPFSLYHSGGHTVNRAVVNHAYANTGTYTIKNVLINGTARQDSLTQSFTNVFCATIPIKFYYDGNSNCTKDSIEPYILQSILTQVDSNGVAIDTISSTNGFYYTAYGSVGDVYSFRIISAPGGIFTTCPSSGVLTYTLTSAGTFVPTLNFGFSCSTIPGTDLRVFTSFRAGSHHFGGQIIVDNTLCPLTPSVLTMRMSPKYAFQNAHPAPTSVVGNLFTWNLNLSGVLNDPVHIDVGCEKPSGVSFTFGDTVLSRYSITSLSGGEIAPGDNDCDRNDTVKSGYDPNYVTVTPEGFIPAGTLLTYTIGFENTGNDTAHNIYVMDTLSEYLDASSLRVITASARMEVSKTRFGGRAMYKFDFPNIKLLDSSHHNLCHGMLMYSIKTLVPLAPGTPIPARAGIYFDDNDVVLTNTATDYIEIPVALNVVDIRPEVQVYPNPANDVLTINADNGAYTGFTVSNSMGQVLIQQPLNASGTQIGIRQLPAGVYYITLTGGQYNMIKKFVKM